MPGLMKIKPKKFWYKNIAMRGVAFKYNSLLFAN